MSLTVAGLAGDALDLEDGDLRAAEQLHRRQISEEQLRKFEGYMAEIFTAFGLDPNTPATEDTPRRFIRALLDVTAGYDGDPKLVKAFDTECRGEPDYRLSQVIEGPIQFFSLCEHHALPFFGQTRREPPVSPLCVCLLGVSADIGSYYRKEAGTDS